MLDFEEVERRFLVLEERAASFPGTTEALQRGFSNDISVYQYKKKKKIVHPLSEWLRQLCSEASRLLRCLPFPEPQFNFVLTAKYILMTKFPKKNLFYVVFFKKTESFDFERKTITKRRSISVFDTTMRITCTVKKHLNKILLMLTF